MFLQQTMGPWFAIQRTSQVTMILLAVAMLFIPHLYQPEEAEAGWFLLGAAIVAGIFLIIEDHPDHCEKCGIHVDSPSKHEITCTFPGCNYTYWTCIEDHYHCMGCGIVNEYHYTYCTPCSRGYFDCKETHGSNCGSGSGSGGGSGQ